MKPEIFYPLRPISFNQHFGANYPCVRDFGLPTQSIITPPTNSDGTTTCPVGYDHLYSHWGMNGHNGTDLMAGEQPVYAAMDGVVIEQQTVPSRGLGLGVLSNDSYDFPEGKYFLKLRYWHLKSFNVQAGDAVKVGDLLGITDNTGYSSGNHLHFEGQLYKKDSGGHPKLVELNNGYANAINIEPYFNGKYARPFLFEKNLWIGMRNSDVTELQSRLGVIQTGFFGTLTFAAVRQFQTIHSLPSTGFVGPLTRAILNNV